MGADSPVEAERVGASCAFLGHKEVRHQDRQLLRAYLYRERKPMGVGDLGGYGHIVPRWSLFGGEERQALVERRQVLGKDARFRAACSSNRPGSAAQRHEVFEAEFSTAFKKPPAEVPVSVPLPKVEGVSESQNILAAVVRVLRRRGLCPRRIAVHVDVLEVL